MVVEQKQKSIFIEHRRRKTNEESSREFSVDTTEFLLKQRSGQMESSGQKRKR